jgi:uncharacterized protein YlxP (DUF503 family)
MSTYVGLLQMRLHVTQAMSLKDKRRVIKSFKDRVRHAHNVSVAEVGELDSHRRCELAVVMVANDRTYIEGVLQKIVNSAAMHRDMVLVDEEIEFF